MTFRKDNITIDTPSERKLVVNKGYCPHCGDQLISRHIHDFVTCSCGKSSLDGGLDYVRTLGDTVTEPLYLDDNYEEIRKHHSRGGRGKDGTLALTWTPLKDMSNKWLQACIDYNFEWKMGNSVTTHLYAKELEYREENDIFIND